MITHEQVTFALNIGGLNAEEQRAFFKTLESALTPEEIKALKIVVAYFRMKNNPYRENALKKAMARQLYEEFNRKDVKNETL